MLTTRGLGVLDRRRFLRDAAGLGGSLALLQLLGQDKLLAASGEPKEPIRPDIDPARPYAGREPHFPARAKRLLIIYCVGAVSHVDSFDYKPDLYQHDGETPPDAPKVTFQGPIGKLAKPKWQFKPRGESGKMLSDLFPQLAERADDLCFLHGMHAKNSAHTQAENFMSTGKNFEGYPSLGAWVTYALGTPNENLPAFVSIPDPRGRPQAGFNNWGPGFLPAAFQGTDFTSDRLPHNLKRPNGVEKAQDQASRDALQFLNHQHLERFPGDTDLAARIASYELAGRMQLSIPAISDLSREPKYIKQAYGADSKNRTKAIYAGNCILARRLLEKGVRVVQLFNGGSGADGRTNWDSHREIVKNHGNHAEILDQPTAALLGDLKQRGMLEDTLVVWCTEFGRMPFMQANGTGRDHNIDGFTCFLAGAGVKAPYSFGATDELGWKAVEDRTSVYDFNATILHLLGLDHERLTYYHNGFERRLTDVHGRVINEILA